MLQRDLTIAPAAERVQLLVVGVGVPAIGAGLHLWRGGVVFPAFLGCVGVVALLGVILYRWIGRDVFLAFNLVAMAVGGVVSRVVVLGLYVTMIGLFGSLLRLVGVDQLRRDFQRNRALATMLVDAPPTPRESYWRQS